MFNKLKHIKDLRDQAKKMQNALSTEFAEVEKNGCAVKINGNMEIISLTIADGIEKERLEKIIPDMTNDAIKKIQKIMASKIQEMGGLPDLGM